MKTKIDTLFKSPFIRKVASLATGTIVAQIFNILFSPIITRLYGPAAYGLMGSLQAIIAIILPITSLSLQVAIVIPKSDDEARRITKLALITNFIMTLIVFVIVILFTDLIAEYMKLTGYSKFLYFLPFVTLFSGMYRILEQWAIRKDSYHHISYAMIGETSLRNFSETLLGFIYPKPSILLVFRSLQYFIKFVIILSSFRLNILIQSLKEKTDLKIILKKYKNFPLFRAPEVFISSISSGIPILMLTSFFGPDSAGFFSIGRTVLGLPTIILSKSIGDVFFSRISKAFNNNENLAPLLLKGTLLLALIGIVPYGIIMLFGDYLFSLVFGLTWSKAGQYAQWMAIWSYFVFANRPSVMTLSVINEQKFHLSFTIIQLFVRLLSLYIGFIIFNSDVIAIAIFGVSGAMLNLLLISITLYKTNRIDKQTYDV